MRKPQILLGDDHGLILEGLRSLLECDYDVVGAVSNGRDLVADAQRLKPDVVLVDVSMPLLNGIEAARQIKQSDPKIKVLFVTQKSDRAYVQTALRLGASGYLLKQAVANEVNAALTEILAGRYYVSPVLRTGIPDALFNPLRNPSELFGESLTPRQREVLQLIAEGKSNKEIAATLEVSVKTVDFHKAGIMGELGLRTTAELTRYAMEHGIIESMI